MGLSRPPQKTGAYCTEGISTYDRVLMFFFVVSWQKKDIQNSD